MMKTMMIATCRNRYTFFFLKEEGKTKSTFLGVTCRNEVLILLMALKGIFPSRCVIFVFKKLIELRVQCILFLLFGCH